MFEKTNADVQNRCKWLDSCIRSEESNIVALLLLQNTNYWLASQNDYATLDSNLWLELGLKQTLNVQLVLLVYMPFLFNLQMHIYR